MANQYQKKSVKKLQTDQPDQFVKFYDRVLRFLSYRPRSEKEILDWFRKKQVGEKIQRLILDKLRRLNLVNDEEFAKWWIEQRASFRPMGKRAIEMELRQKGIPKEIINNLSSKLQAPISELDLAKKSAEKKIKLYSHLPELQFRQKLSSFLLRRGFSWETIEEVLTKLVKKSKIETSDECPNGIMIDG